MDEFLIVIFITAYLPSQQINDLIKATSSPPPKKNLKKQKTNSLCGSPNGLTSYSEGGKALVK